MTPLHIAIVVAVVGAGVGTYELVFKKKPKAVAPGAPTPDVGGAPAPNAASTAQAPTAPSGRPGAPVLGSTTGRAAGFDPRFLAKHPEWVGWHVGMPKPHGRPAAPMARLGAALGLRGQAGPRPTAPAGSAIIGGMPVMSGDPVKDVAALIAWHGIQLSDSQAYKRFQAMAGLVADGKFGPLTASALQQAATAKGIPLPPLPTLPSYPSAPAYPSPHAPSNPSPHAQEHDVNS